MQWLKNKDLGRFRFAERFSGEKILLCGPTSIGPAYIVL